MKKKTQSSRSLADRLDFIRPRITKRIVRARAGRMPQITRRLRIWLPGLAAFVIMVLFLWPMLRPNFTMTNVVKNIPDLVIDNLRYSGTDSKNQPYSLMAAQATRPSSLEGIYDLKKPEGEITLNNGTWIDTKADYGRYDEKGKKLWLGGNVQIFNNKGYQVTTEEAQINLNNNDAWGDKDVLIQGNFGTVRGEGFRFLDSGRTVIIEGPGKAVLRTKRTNGADNAS
ncbi:MAG: LPS export ABC transporter periplasmic protein LptC [Alphaproteobacteria bacterium]|nr:LPS export ABC transporter periplasmic protein LptC [Alphaproteobacteria bacterium]